MIFDLMTDKEIIASYCDRFNLDPAPSLVSVIDAVKAKHELIRLDLNALLGKQPLMETYRDLACKYSISERRIRQVTQRSGNDTTTH